MSHKSQALIYEVDAVHASKVERLSVSVSTPYKNSKGDWACLFELRGVKEVETSREFYGADALQALILNLFLLHSILSGLRKKGYIFRCVSNGEEVFPDTMFEAFTKEST